MQRGYEALVIFKAAITDEELSRQVGALESQITKVGGAIETSQLMGRRRLAFTIGRQHEGSYHLVRFTLPTAQVAELERIFRLNEMIVRFMILTQDEVGPPAPAAAASRG